MPKRLFPNFSQFFDPIPSQISPVMLTQESPRSDADELHAGRLQFGWPEPAMP